MQGVPGWVVFVASNLGILLSITSICSFITMIVFLEYSDPNWTENEERLAF
jgi:hypothetical protein